MEIEIARGGDRGAEEEEGRDQEGWGCRENMDPEREGWSCRKRGGHRPREREMVVQEGEDGSPEERGGVDRDSESV